LNPINIIFIIYDLEPGGPELRLLDFAKHFPSDIKMHICVTSENLTLLPDFLEFHSDIQIVPVSKGYLELNRAWEIYKYVKINHISVINTFGLKELFLSVAIKAFSGWKLKTVHHSVDLLHNYCFRQRILHGILLKSTNTVLCNSKQSMKLIKGFLVPEDKIAVIKNGINTKDFIKNSDTNESFKKLFGWGNSEIILGTIANFRGEKNYPFLINAFRILLQKHPNLRLICVGGGHLFEEMKETIRSYGLEKEVILTGYSKNVSEYLSLMDIFVFCSLQEGLPNAILQAMSMEHPVIASEVGGCPEIIDNMTNGILYPSNKLEKFTGAVEMLLDDKNFASKLGANARRTVEKKFSLNRMIEEYTEFYQNLSTC
jgi:glycosyltransferase involved in cell wall biosynthesis